MPIVQRGTVTAQPGRAYASQPLRVVPCQCGCARSQALDGMLAEFGLRSRPVSSLPLRRPATRRSSLSLFGAPMLRRSGETETFPGLVEDGRLRGHDGRGVAGGINLRRTGACSQPCARLPAPRRAVAWRHQESDVWPLGAQGRKGDKRCSRPYKRSQFQRPTRS